MKAWYVVTGRQRRATMRASYGARLLLRQLARRHDNRAHDGGDVREAIRVLRAPGVLRCSSKARAGMRALAAEILIAEIDRLRLLVEDYALLAHGSGAHSVAWLRAALWEVHSIADAYDGLLAEAVDRAALRGLRGCE